MTQVNLEQLNSIPANKAIFSDFVIANPIDQIRLYDLMLQEWLERFRAMDLTGSEEPSSEPVRVIRGTPNRAYAQLQDLNRDKVYDLRHINKSEIIPTPWISFYLTSMIFDATRFNRNYGTGQYKDREMKEIWLFQYPVPNIFTYVIDLFASRSTTVNLLEQWFQMQFDHNNLYLNLNPSPVNPAVYGKEMLVRIELENIQRSGHDFASEQVEYRLTMNIKIHGWLFRPAKLEKTIHDFNYEIYFQDNQGNWMQEQDLEYYFGRSMEAIYEEIQDN